MNRFYLSILSYQGAVPMPILNRRQLVSTLSASGALTLLPSCIKINDYQGNKWWLEGGYNPVQEELDTTSFRVEGEIPRHLNGLYVRNGGNFRGLEAPHYFIGDGMLHGIWLENGNAMHYPFYHMRSIKPGFRVSH